MGQAIQRLDDRNVRRSKGEAIKCEAIERKDNRKVRRSEGEAIGQSGYRKVKE